MEKRKSEDEKKISNISVLRRICFEESIKWNFVRLGKFAVVILIIESPIFSSAKYKTFYGSLGLRCARNKSRPSFQSTSNMLGIHFDQQRGPNSWKLRREASYHAIISPPFRPTLLKWKFTQELERRAVKSVCLFSLRPKHASAPEKPIIWEFEYYLSEHRC